MTFTLKNLDEAIDEQKQTSIITSIIEPLDFVLYIEMIVGRSMNSTNRLQRYSYEGYNVKQKKGELELFGHLVAKK